MYFKRNEKNQKLSFLKGAGWWSEDHFQTFRYHSENYWWDKWWKVHTFQRFLSYFKRKKKGKKSWVFSKAVFSIRWCSEEHFQKFRYPSENYWLDKWWKVHTFQRVILYFKLKKTKKNWVFSKARGGGWRTIFRLLGILLKIIGGTNGERCILFRGLYCTLN